ncbi:MAG: signal peptidase I [Pseudomonadota bacterium]
MTKKIVSRRRRILREALSLAGLIILVLAARSSLADHYYVPSGSMEHTLQVGDRVVVDKRAYGLRLPFTLSRLLPGETVERGAVVIFDSPLSGKRLIKRIVAVGGDEVRLVDGRLTINDIALAGNGDIERFGSRIAALKLDNGGGPDVSGTIPSGMLLAVGDHRGNSLDGRRFGLVPERAIYGRAVAVYYRRGDGITWRPL